MSSFVPLLEKHQIVVGKPLPFSIFTAERKLLLAAGHVVANDRLRDMLMTNGHYRSTAGPGEADDGVEPAETDEERDPLYTSLELLRRDYDSGNDGHRLSISIARNATDKAYTVQLLGTHKQSIIVTAPVNPDGSLLPVTPGQAWLCRTFQMTSAFRFSTVALKSAFEPFPHIHLKLQKQVEHRRVRGSPRAKVSVRGELHTPDVISCVLADLSTSGARVAVEADKALPRGQEIRLLTTLEVLQSKFELALNCSVVNAFGPSDTRHPAIAFYGLKFSAPSETDSLVLHGFVSGHLLAEFHSLWQMLSMASSPSSEAL